MQMSLRVRGSRVRPNHTHEETRCYAVLFFAVCFQAASVPAAWLPYDCFAEHPPMVPNSWVQANWRGSDVIGLLDHYHLGGGGGTWGVGGGGAQVKHFLCSIISGTGCPKILF